MTSPRMRSLIFVATGLIVSHFSFQAVAKDEDAKGKPLTLTCSEVATGSLVGVDANLDGFLSLSTILAHKQNEKLTGPGSAYATAFNALGKPSQNSIFISGEEKQISGRLGFGVRGLALLADDGMVYKIPRSAKDLPTFEIEIAIERHLQKNFEKYKIPVLGSTKYGPLGSYLQRRRILPEQMAEKILAAGQGTLSAPQQISLKALLKNAQQFARETGIGLDLKAANLFWDGNTWGIFDLGPRTSYLPYGYTLDVPDFETYLKIWTLNEPDGLPAYLSIQEMKQQLYAQSETQKKQIRSILKDFPKMQRNWGSDFSNRKVLGFAGTGAEGTVKVGQAMEGRKFSQREGRLFENQSIDVLPAGNYTFVILADGTLIFGKAEDEFDFGVKHFQIANGRLVLAAGEVKVSDGIINTFSGAFFEELQRMTGKSNLELANVVAAAMSVGSSRTLKGTNQNLFEDKVVPIDPARYKKYCLEDDEFFRLNKNAICYGTR